ncbi:MAG: hypothetical protein BWY83_00342 [bacterium ADurb.Bin478]|nr:MAG: hypothetical protein BWY83_00342 [bacterium ADurb.Bin478]
MQDGQVLERLDAFKPLFHDHGRLAHGFNPFRSGFADHPGGQRRAGKWDSLEQCRRKTQRLAEFAHAILAQLDQRLQNAIAEYLLWIDAQLFKNVVLAFDAGHGLIHIREDGALKQKPGAAVAHDAAEHLLVKSLSDGLPLLLRIRKPLQRSEKLLLRIDHFNLHSQFLEKGDHLFRFVGAHQTVVDKHGLEPLFQRLVAKQGDGGRVDAARQGVERQAVTDDLANFLRFLPDELLGVEPAGFDLFNHGKDS